MEVIERYTPDFIVLAKYMRVLTPAFVQRYPARIVNIHHHSCRRSWGPAVPSGLRTRGEGHRSHGALRHR